MKGYVKNISGIPLYFMKRFVNPGEKIDVSVIKERYWEESGANTAAEFVKWLRMTVFSDSRTWEIDITSDPSEREYVKKSTDESSKTTESKSDNEKAANSRAHVVTTNPNVKVAELDAKRLLRLSADKCKEEIARCTDENFLKRLLARAKTMPRKQKTCKVIEERLSEIMK